MASTNDFNPSDSGYVAELLPAGVVCIALGAVTFVSFALFFIIRACCACCGKGCCARSDVPPARMPSYAIRLFAAVLLILAVVGGAGLTAKGKRTGHSVLGLVDTTLETIEAYQKQLVDIRTNMEAVNAKTGFEVDVSELSNAQAELASARDSVQANYSDLKSGTDAFGAGITTLGVIVVITTIVGFFFVFLQRLPFLVIYLVLAFIISASVWSTGGIMLVANNFVTDACDMMQMHVNGNRNEWVWSEAGCSDVAGAIMAAENAAASTLNGAIGDTNELIQEVNNNRGTNIPMICSPYRQTADGRFERSTESTENCVLCTEASLKEAYGPLACDAPGRDPTTDAGYQACLAASPSRPLPQLMYGSIIVAGSGVDAMAPALKDLRGFSECSYLDTAFTLLLRNNCDDLKTQTGSVATLAIVAAVGISLASLYFCICTRCIRRHYETSSNTTYAVEDPTAKDPFAKEGPSVDELEGGNTTLISAA